MELIHSMNLFDLFCRSRTLLKKEPEEGCAFIFYNRINDLPHLKNKKGMTGLYNRVGVFFYNIFIRASLYKPAKKRSDYLLYSGTKNQYDSLLSTFIALNEKSSVISVLDGRWLSKSCEVEVNIKFTPRVVLVSLFLFILRSVDLYKRLKHAELSDSVNLYFDRFCSVYYYIPYYFDLLDEVKPKYVIMSNDHSPANRALLFVAKSMGIKTVYMQHASVSTLFPVLDFDYSFLDGYCAYNIYKEIELNKNANSLETFNEKYMFLTGQKKITFSNSIGPDISNNCCGVGFSHLDGSNFIIKVIESLLLIFEQCIVRMHPSHSLSELKKIADFFSENKSVKFSVGKNVSIETFISNISVFFGSTTSLHLEVALSGLRCFYIENEEFKGSDYYGYERAGLVIPIHFPEITVAHFSDVGLLQGSNEINAIKRFSATYNTSWFGREGELVVSILEKVEESQMLDKPIQIGHMHKALDSNMWSI